MRQCPAVTECVLQLAGTISPLKSIHETPKKSQWSEFLESNLRDDESTTRDEDYRPDAEHVSDVTRGRCAIAVQCVVVAGE